jgi:outer membrane immunogenic protein
MQRAVLCGVVLAVSLSTASHAADLYVEPEIAEAAMAAAEDWSGAYVGIKGGYGAGNANFSWAVPGTEADVPIEGWLAGVVAGAGFQSGNFYVGAEGEASWTNVGGADSCADPQWDCFVDSHWIADLEAQLGVAAGAALAYVHGGIAAVGLDAGETDLIGFADGFDSSVALGWVAGAGLKLGVAENVHLVGEYSFYDVQSTHPAGTVDVDETVVDSTFHVVSLGLNIGF